MRMIKRSLEALAVVAVLALQAVPSQAQPFEKTFVRSDGSDGLDCQGLSTRCVSIARGVLNVNAGGTVNVLDPNTQAAFTIDKSLSILAVGGENTVVRSSAGVAGPSIQIVTSGNDIVTIRGVSVDRQGVGLDDVGFVGSGVLHLENCFIRGSGTGFGIKFVPNGAAELHISNCTIADNGGAAGGGILIKPTGAGSVKVVLDNVRVENNRVGIQVDGTSTSGTNSVTMRNSTVAGSAAFGFNAIDSGGGATNVMIEGSTSSNNGTHGVVANGANVTVRMRDSTVSGNHRGLLPVTSGEIISHGGNVVAGNTVNGAFTSSLPLQ